MHELTAISPLDGRYRDKIKHLENYFSEYALIRYRLFVELEWFIFMCNEVKLEGTRMLTAEELKILRGLSTSFQVLDAERVKKFESVTNHDVKAVEYFIKEHLKAYPKMAARASRGTPRKSAFLSEFIHFGCTSEDINNLAYNLLLKDFTTKEYLPLATGVTEKLFELAKKYKAVPMLSHTHGQPASPTTLGKEMINFVARLEGQLKSLQTVKLTGKFSGAVGNFNAHSIAYPDIDWIGVSHRFVTYLGLKPNAYTTQIEPHDAFAELFDSAARLNTVLIALCRDFWTYIGMGYFKLKPKAGEVGSSTMPHKVNPIDFENAEGNFGLANALFSHFSQKLPVSRMQRDLTDSTVCRNFGSAFGYSVLAMKSLLNGLNKVEADESKLEADLCLNWEVLTEAIQTVMRKNGIENAYEKLKELSRGKKLTEKETVAFIKQLKIPQADKKRLLALTPSTYTGIAEHLVENYKLGL